MWILEPISIATKGYVGLGPNSTGFCPAPLAIASHGYIRFSIPDDEIGDGGHAKGHGHVIAERIPTKKRNVTRIAGLAVLAIKEFYE